MTPIQTLYTYLNDAGLFNDWVDSQGATQPPPVVQMRWLDEEAANVSSSDRVLLIKTAATGGGNRYVSEPVFLFAILGTVGESSIYAEDYAELLYSALLNFTHADCIISIDPVGRINGPYKMASGRFVHDMEFSSKVDSGLI